MNILLFIVCISIVAHNAYSMNINDQSADEQDALKSHLNDEFNSMENLYPQRIPPFLGRRRIDSAEKYFDWADKTNRPMEYLRGKRFWLFTKKDENGLQQEIPYDAHSSAKQGIWRSGIVGRRRR